MIIFMQCVTGVIVAFIIGSIFIFDATLREFLREARIRDEQLAFLKQKVNKYDEGFSLLEKKSKELQLLLTQLNKELALIKQNNTDLQQEARTRDEQLAILQQKVNKHDEKFPLLQEKNKQLMDEFSIVKQKKTEHYFGECLWTDYVNYFDRDFTFAPEDYVICGVSSYHPNSYMYESRNMAQEGKSGRPVSKISSEDGSESFFKTAMRIELETAEGIRKRISTDTPVKRAAIPEEATENDDDFKMPVVSTKTYQLSKGIPSLQVRSPSPRAVSPDRLRSPFFQRTRINKEPEKPDSVLDFTKALTMNRIAKTLVSNQKTRLQRLEETGNVTINSPLKKFNPNLVKDHLYKILKNKLKDITYDPKLCLPLSKSLSEETRDAVKALKFPRYKFVSVVTIGQLQSSTISICSRSLWDCNTDNYACAEYRNETIYAVAMIYATFLD